MKAQRALYYYRENTRKILLEKRVIMNTVTLMNIFVTLCNFILLRKYIYGMHIGVRVRVSVLVLANTFACQKIEERKNYIAKRYENTR